MEAPKDSGTITMTRVFRSWILWAAGYAVVATGCKSESRGWGSKVAFVAVFALLGWGFVRLLRAERRHQEHVRWLTRNGKPADARILRTEVQSSSPHGREPSQMLAVTLAIDREEGGAITVEACLSFPISRVGKLYTSERLPVFYNPEKPTDLTVDWDRF